MIFTDEFDILYFEFDGGAYEKIMWLSEKQLLILQGYICYCLGSKSPSRQDINDFVQFECDDFLEILDKVLIIVSDED